MNFHEYQAKQLFGDYGIAVPKGKVAHSPDEAVSAAKDIGGDFWVVKAQIHAGGRGKAGGVKLAKTFDEVHAYAKGMLGTKMATYQTAGVELPVDSVLVTQATDIAKELYLSVLVDRATQSVTFIASAEGGMDIEQVAAEKPDAIKTLHVDFVEGLQPYQTRDLGFALGLDAKQVGQLSKIMLGLYKLFNEKDLALVELNPLAILTDEFAGGAGRQDQLRRQRQLPPPGTGRHARRAPGRRDRGVGQQVRPELRDHGRQHRLHGQRRGPGHGDHGHHQAQRR